MNFVSVNSRPLSLAVAPRCARRHQVVGADWHVLHASLKGLQQACASRSTRAVSCHLNTMNETKYYLLEREESLRNIIIQYGYIAVISLWFLATVIDFFIVKELFLNYFLIHIASIFVTEWLARNFIIRQRPQFICIGGNELILWYLLGMIRIEYSNRWFQILPSYK